MKTNTLVKITFDPIRQIKKDMIIYRRFTDERSLI